MSWRLPTRLPRERSAQPFVGYKLAYPMLSADGARVGFAGVLLGRSQVYGITAQARCVHNPRHRCPRRLCDCGFYCLHSRDAARALACDPRHHSAALLQVTASGRYIRYEDGLRYSHQRVRGLRVGRCRCGRAAELLVDAGDGQVGWRRLVGSCLACAGSRPALPFAGFAALAGADLSVTSEDPPAAPWTASAPADAPADVDQLVPLLTAEVALLQARLDDLQERLARLSPPPGGGHDAASQPER